MPKVIYSIYLNDLSIFEGIKFNINKQLEISNLLLHFCKNHIATGKYFF